jgi:two-component system nitrogen regulation sensor histidine kinase NtrY
MPSPKRQLNHDQHVFVGVLLAGAPAILVSMWHLWLVGDQSPKVQWTLSLIIIGFWFGFAFSVQNRVVRTLQTMANLLSALREGDFSIRARGAIRTNPFGDVMSEINSLGNILRTQRLGAMEATALLRSVMEEIDVAIFAFDSDGVLRLVNREGQELLSTSAEKILGRSAIEIGLSECINGPSIGVLKDTDFPGGSGRWGMRRTNFREGGLPHQLVVVADLSEALREEELKAWQRLVRVLGHELNNSLAPIKSIAGSLSSMIKRPAPRADDWEEDMRNGLDIIASRAEGLSRFMQAYSRLAKLPKPAKSPCEVKPLVHRVVQLELRLPVTIVGGPDLTVPCDGPQIEQVLINLIKNAVEAALESSEPDPDSDSEPPLSRPQGEVRLSWIVTDQMLEFRIEDNGPGIGQATNLFVPFFTTKPTGSGIGLVLCRQIAENHEGELYLENRTDASGTTAVLQLPLQDNAA